MRVVVVGAGIVGASTAFHLVEAGADVTVVDHRHVGRATPAGAGIICPWPTAASDEAFVSLYVAGATALAQVVARVAERTDVATGYARVGAISLADDDAALDVVEERTRRRAGDDPTIGELRRISGSEAGRRFPPLRDDLPGLWIEGGARLDGRTMTSALLRAARLEPRVGLARLIVEGDRVAGVAIDAAPLTSDAVVVAGGAWTAELLEPLGVPIDVEPQKGQIIHLRMPTDQVDAATSTWPSILPPGPHYLLAFDDDRVVVGATRETGSGFDTRVTAAGQREVLDAALRWAPGLADAEVIETRVGLRPLASSGHPTIGPVPGIDGLFVGTGMGPAGLTIGPLAGRMLADHAVHA